MNTAAEPTNSAEQDQHPQREPRASVWEWGRAARGDRYRCVLAYWMSFEIRSTPWWATPPWATEPIISIVCVACALGAPSDGSGGGLLGGYGHQAEVLGSVR